ncbi:MAG: hypothetical protein HN348_20400 [Proteobacteria bacterium]|jgi:hypothetical protein|nr:hypothetical protein [Pseudomonadota bacterium]
MLEKIPLVLLLVIMACQTENPADSDADGGACATLDDCDADLVCLAGVGTGVCVPVCSAQANECSGSAQCAGVGSLEVDVCQEPVDDAKDAPHIPCTTDEECDSLQSGTICAEFQGQRDCTISCDKESACDMPTIGGVGMDFLTCIPDEGDTSRDACLPDEACFDNPLDCILGLPF